ncbi:hypothetical protein RUM44_004857 [Polyplax serrata]|uniref:BTB domain-containing protein n=1 Tax=Polyplax serrata TaxID=468196 RepID=A0ABR1B4R5_POLSC
MCHCEDSNNCKKSPLNRTDFLYDNELDSDVVFIVGMEPDVWRIPGHKKVLSEANLVFRALMEGPLATRDETIVVEDVEGRAFDYLLRYLYGRKVFFQSASTALSTLYAAHKYLCSGLIELCVKYLDENLNTKNVIEIYTHARLYAVGSGQGGLEPSAPEASTDTCDLHTPVHCYPPSIINNNNNVNSFSENSDLLNNNNDSRNDYKSLQASSIPFWSEALVHNCLQFMDENADQVLSQESIEDMSAVDLKEVVKRDTLKIKSEYVVFLALERWANRECKRRKLNLNMKNRRFVLGDLLYEIRFPFFTSDEFVFGPIQNGWLEQQELTFFSGLLSKSKGVGQVPQQWKSHLDRLCKKRMYNENDSFTLSQRTYIIESDKSKEKELKKNNFIFRKIKSKKSSGRERNCKSSGTENENERTCTKCFSEFMVDILVCLFD